MEANRSLGLPSTDALADGGLLAALKRAAASGANADACREREVVSAYPESVAYETQHRQPSRHSLARPHAPAPHLTSSYRCPRYLHRHCGAGRLFGMGPSLSRSPEARRGSDACACARRRCGTLRSAAGSRFHPGICAASAGAHIPRRRWVPLDISRTRSEGRALRTA